jgi:hypothetical protein
MEDFGRRVAHAACVIGIAVFAVVILLPILLALFA